MLLQVLSTRTQRQRLRRGTAMDRALETVHREHEAILNALAVRDGTLAASAAAVHIAAVEQWLSDQEPPQPSGR